MESMVAGISEIKTMQRPSLSAGAPVVEDSKDVKRKIVYSLADDQKELRAIRIRLGMTKHGFANALGIRQCTLDSYEYGKTKGVPVGLMDSARTLEVQKSDSISTSREMFEAKSMSAILSEWAEKLNIPMDNAAALGRLLNTTPTTIRRWRENKVRPDIGKLTKLAARVDRGPVGALRLSAIYAIKKLRGESAESKGFFFIPDSTIQATLDRIKEVSDPSERLVKLTADFETMLSHSKKIAGPVTFVQVGAVSLSGFVRGFLSELSFDDLDEDGVEAIE